MALSVRKPECQGRMKHESEARADGASTPRTEPRPLTPSERIVDAWVHWLAIVAAAAAVVVLMAVAVPQGSPALTFSLLVYGVSLLVMLTSSALYNGGFASKDKDLLRRIDHAAIFVMIAGTYTPFVVVKLPGAWGRWLLVYVWAVAGFGVILKLIWVDRFARLSVILYLFLGWTIVVAIKPLWSSFSFPAIVLLVAGGMLYSIGVVFHLWERLPYQQPIWHALVVAAAACHYAAVIAEIALPGTLA
jgi:hemolysin III